MNNNLTKYDKFYIEIHESGDDLKQKTLFFVIVSLIIITGCACFSVTTFALSSYSLNGFSDNSSLFAADNNIFLVDIDGGSVKIKSLDTNACDISLSFEESVFSYSYCNGKFYFCRNKSDVNSNCVLISSVSPYSYDGFYSTTAIRNVTAINKNTIAFDRFGNIYISDRNNRKAVKKYSKDAFAVDSFDIGSDVTQIFEHNNKICIVCDRLLFIKNNSLTDGAIEVNNSYPFRSMQNSLLCDSFLNVYSCDDSKVNLIFNTRSIKPTAEKITADEDCVVCLCDDTLFTYDINSKNLLTSTAVKADDIALFNSKLYLLKHSGNQAVISEISKKKLTSVEVATTSPHSTAHTEPFSSVVNNYDLAVSSGEYSVDNSKKIISDIAVGTTVAQLKKNLSFNCDFALYYKGKIRKTGNVGTGMTAVFSNDNDKAQYTLTVKGDCTGEGNVNSRDKKAVFDYILGEKSVLNGVYLTAADMNSDKAVDTKDLLLTAKAFSKR